MILVYIDHNVTGIRKASLECISYAKALSNNGGGAVHAIVLGTTTADLTVLSQYGAAKILHANVGNLNSFDAAVHTGVIAEIAKDYSVIIAPHTISGKAIASRLSATLKAGLVSGAVALPDTSNGFVVKKSVFSGKAFANVAITTDKKIITVSPNTFPAVVAPSPEEIDLIHPNLKESKIQIVSTQKVEGETPLSEADIVVSGGRGLKGPEHWNIVTDLAKALGAATACSRPVADMGWRPHHEHVGQTGLAIAPNLYIAVGISGAIQHLAGVNRSKTIVVINKDPEAPFFKAADYGIVGDAFEILPKLTAALQK